ncbi:MAG: hypothetical protein CMF50_02645 [Legionellales bacterium]|nr:hypothetical protein [Legionellales bacterium]|tara:strand:+ start:136 stop:1233 length:1098 start_codon:yes stop_codon:yes gene_type:complete
MPLTKKEEQLHDAVMANDASTVIKLTKTDVNVNAQNQDGETPLLIAVSNRNMLIVQALISTGGDVNHGNYPTPLQLAIMTNNIDIVLALIKAGANVDDAGATSIPPLTLAIERDHTEIARALIQAGADVDAATDKGYTPLHSAIKKNNMNIAIALIDADANVYSPVNPEYVDSITLSELAINNGKDEIITRFVNRYHELWMTLLLIMKEDVSFSVLPVEIIALIVPTVNPSLTRDSIKYQNNQLRLNTALNLVCIKAIEVNQQGNISWGFFPNPGITYAANCIKRRIETINNSNLEDILLHIKSDMESFKGCTSYSYHPIYDDVISIITSALPPAEYNDSNETAETSLSARSDNDRRGSGRCIVC